MPLLNVILQSLQIIEIVGDSSIQIAGLAIDSRKVEEGYVYAAIKGSSVDGHDFIQKALENGARCVIHSDIIDVKNNNIVYIRVADTSHAIGCMAAQFYGSPSKDLVVVGVTGTNGKTTIATLLYNLFQQLGYKCGLISTVQNIIDGEIYESTHTTPDAISIQALFFQMKNAGCSHVFMEVSSHAVHQKRISGIEFNGAIFSNITHDHLDYHGTFDEYITVKKAFFDALPKTAFALTNIDDKRGAVMLQNTEAKKLSYSLRQVADYKAKVLENHIYGLLLHIDNNEVHFRLAGSFNAYNLLAVYATAVELGMDKNTVLSILSNTTGAAGRFEVYRSPNEGIVGIIDYAHTPDALLNVLQTIKKFEGHKQVITVVGCGGDRDKTKRPVMGLVSCEHSDKVIFTSDNPRTEDPQVIIDEMYTQLGPQHIRKVLQIVDRTQAIKTAIMMSEKDDIVLIAGKGHETYQEINGVKHPFDDKEILLKQFSILNK